ncbi:MAG TPA: hypothetical protein DGG95_17100 [Cytophagales bacterium]|nr:hypothetical protein [Cytophagales bacterium]
MQKVNINGLPALFLLANSISWFSLTMLAIGDIANAKDLLSVHPLLIASAYFGGLIGSAAIGATILQRSFRSKSFLSGWVFFGVVTCLLFSYWAATDAISLTLKSLLLGLSAGAGIPACFSFFGYLTKIEKRGKAGAIMFFIVQVFTVAVLLSATGIDTQHEFLILAIWRLIGISGALFYKPVQSQSKEYLTSLKSIIRERTFLLYFLPWFLFTLINFIESPIIEKFFGQSLYDISVLATTIISSISAIVAGILCDLKGRKVTGIIGFVLLGLSYAILSFFSGEIPKYLYILFDGVAWGILFVNFIFVLWGDLSEEKIREKYYLLGSLPFLLSGMIEILIKPFIENINMDSTRFTSFFFPFASFFLFLAIVPLLYATETLPEKAMKDRDLKSYLEKAQKIAKGRTSSKKGTNQKDDQPENTQESAEDKKARELAEKYY